MVLGYVSIAYNQMEMAQAQIKEIKENEMNLENNYNVYLDIKDTSPARKLKKKGRNIAFST